MLKSLFAKRKAHPKPEARIDPREQLPGGMRGFPTKGGTYPDKPTACDVAGIQARKHDMPFIVFELKDPARFYVKAMGAEYPEELFRSCHVANP